MDGWIGGQTRGMTGLRREGQIRMEVWLEAG